MAAEQLAQAEGLEGAILFDGTLPMIDGLWEVRTLRGGLSLELRGGKKPALVLVQGSDRVRVELADVKVVVAAMADAAADLAEVLAAGGVYHA